MPPATSNDRTEGSASDASPGGEGAGDGNVTSWQSVGGSPPPPAPVSADAPGPEVQARRARIEPGGRWALAVVVGLAIALPFGWLLSYAAALPYFLGLFFFVLFGIMIGAVMHRIASPRRPYRPVMLAVGTTIVVTVGWAASIVVEGRGFPADMAMKAGQVTRRITGDISAYRAAVAGEVRNFLRERYPPGGVMGYVRWILTSGDVKKGQLPSVAQTLRRRPCKGWWAVRAILSLGLFAFGVGSQTWPLKLATEPAVRAIDEVKKA